jgi:hypothetical protein
MTQSVHCHEEVPFITDADLQEATAGVAPEVLRSGLGAATRAELNETRALCADWAAEYADAGADDPVRSSIPALLLAGEYDPITPPAWGALAARTLSNSFFYEFPSAGHGVLGHAPGCAAAMIAQFLDRPSEAPESACIGAIPPVDFLVEDPGTPPVSDPEQAPRPASVNGIAAPDAGSGARADAGARRIAVFGVLAAALALVVSGRVLRCALIRH